MSSSGGWSEVGPCYVAGRPHGMQFVRPTGVPGEFESWFRPCEPSEGCQECTPGVPEITDHTEPGHSS